MAVDVFLKIDGIDGASKDSKYKGGMDSASFSWGAPHTGTSHAGGGSGGRKVNLGGIHFTSSHLSKASPKLFLASWTQQRRPNPSGL